MKSIYIVALIAVLALTANFALADVCDDGSCTSTVALTQAFHTGDCSGNATLSIASNYTDSCEVADSSSYNVSFLVKCSSSGLISYTTPDNNVCSKTTAQTVSVTTGTGVCVQSGANTSSILWCNRASISNKFKAAKQTVNATLITQALEACNITTGCSDATGSLRVYTAAGCKAENLSMIYPPSLFANYHLNLDTCYNTNASSVFSRNNLQATCSNGQYKILYTTGGCGSSSNTLAVQSFPVDTCIHYSTNLWVSISCRSAASTLVASAPLVFLLFVLFLFI